jgi:CHASE3 domain sensor protein
MNFAMISKLLTGVLAALACSVIFFLHDSFRNYDHTYQVINAVHEVRRSIGRSQDSMRGYLISRQSYFLVGYNQFFHKIMSNVDVVDELTKDNVVQQRNINELRKMVNDKVSSIEKLMAIANGGDFERAREIVSEGDTEMVAQSIDSMLASILHEEERLLIERKRKMDENLAYATWGIPALF